MSMNYTWVWTTHEYELHMSMTSYLCILCIPLLLHYTLCARVYLWLHVIHCAYPYMYILHYYIMCMCYITRYILYAVYVSPLMTSLDMLSISSRSDTSYSTCCHLVSHFVYHFNTTLHFMCHPIWRCNICIPFNPYLNRVIKCLHYIPKCYTFNMTSQKWCHFWIPGLRISRPQVQISRSQVLLVVRCSICGHLLDSPFVCCMCLCVVPFGGVLYVSPLIPIWIGLLCVYIHTQSVTHFITASHLGSPFWTPLDSMVVSHLT